MQVSVEQSGDLERKLAICVPCEEIESEVSERLRDVARKTRIPGFRPGKAPLRIVRQRFSDGIANEVVKDKVQSSYHAALTDQGIVPAGLLSIDPTPWEPGNDLEFVATIEVYPQMPALNLDGVTIRKPVVEVTGRDVDNTMQDIRLRHADSYVAKPGKSERGDRLTVDFARKTEGENLPDEQAVEGHSFILGNMSMPQEFENGLLGVGKDEVRIIPVAYLQSHDNPALAGKEVEYSVTVRAVDKPVLPELDDEFAQKMGIRGGGIERLRQEVERNLAHELDERLRKVKGHRVMDGLLQKNQIAAPKSLVEREIDYSIHMIEQYMAERNLPMGEVDRDDYAAEAKRRVVQGLVVRAIIDQQSIRVEPDEVKARVTDMAASYEQPEAFTSRFMSNPEQMKRIESLLVEEKVMEAMLKTATVEEEKLSFREFMDNRAAGARSET